MNSNQRIVSLANQATIALAKRNYEAALTAYGNALKIAEELKRSPLIVVLLNHTGHTIQAQGENQDAVIAYDSAHNLFN
jgi:ATP/maltotriose-dependent transcriptional regulator MalT